MNRRKVHRVADDITAGMKAIEKMIASGKQPTETFTARTIDIPDPCEYGASRSACAAGFASR